MELDQLKKIENFSFKNLYKSDAFLAMFIAIHTGMRFGEIAALRLNNVNFEQKTISIEKSMDMFHNEREPKTKSSIRTIKVDEKLLSVLKNLRLNQTELIIKSNNQLVGRYLRDTIKELNIKQVTFHALRHSHASYLISRGVAIQYVSERLGHADVSITQQVYSHLLNSLRVKEESKAISLLDDI